MKTLITALVLCLGIISGASAQNKKDIQTDTIKVDGVCGDCKKRIEKAAYVPGVKRAEWDMETHLLVVTYKSSKTNVKDIETSIAAVGYNAGDVKASDEAYKKLPACCAYKEDGATLQH